MSSDVFCDDSNADAHTQTADPTTHTTNIQRKSPNQMNRQHINVLCRIRSITASSESTRAYRISGNTLSYSSNPAEQFTFDGVYDSDTTQHDMYKACVPILDACIEGYNCTLFVYGQTGSGKTYTAYGSTDQPGIVPRLIDSVYHTIQHSSCDIEYSIKLSYVEIYNECVNDLLDINNRNLRLRESNDKSIIIENVTEIYSTSLAHTLAIINAGQNNRAVAATNMNSQSSRSHSVFTLTLKQHNQSNNTKKLSKLCVVDLAGSERVVKSGIHNDLSMSETKNINRSLSALGNCIMSLTENQAHVPFRDSKLTRLLSDSLGGNAVATIIVTVHPLLDHGDETMSTLKFGARAKRIKNKPVINSELTVEQYKQQITTLNKTIISQQQLIDVLQNQAIPATDTTQNRSDRLVTNTVTGTLSTLQQQVEVLEQQIAEYKDKDDIANDNITRLTNELLDSQRDVTSLTSQHQQSTGQLICIHQQLLSYQSSILSYETQKQQYIAQQSDNDIQIQRLQNDNYELRTKLKLLQNQPINRAQHQRHTSITQINPAIIHSQHDHNNNNNDTTQTQQDTIISTPRSAEDDKNRSDYIDSLKLENTRLMDDLCGKIEQAVVIELAYQELRDTLSTTMSDCTTDNSNARIESLNRSLMQQNDKLLQMYKQSHSDATYANKQISIRDNTILSLQQSITALQSQLQIQQDITRNADIKIQQLTQQFNQMSSANRNIFNTIPAFTSPNNIRAVMRGGYNQSMYNYDIGSTIANQPAQHQHVNVVTREPSIWSIIKDELSSFGDAISTKPAQSNTQHYNTDNISITDFLTTTSAIATPPSSKLLQTPNNQSNKSFVNSSAIKHKFASLRSALSPLINKHPIKTNQPTQHNNVIDTNKALLSPRRPSLGRSMQTNPSNIADRENQLAQL